MGTSKPAVPHTFVVAASPAERPFRWLGPLGWHMPGLVELRMLKILACAQFPGGTAVRTHRDLRQFTQIHFESRHRTPPHSRFQTVTESNCPGLPQNGTSLAKTTSQMEGIGVE